MNLSNFDSLSSWGKFFNDDAIWKPIYEDEELLRQFNEQCLIVEQSANWEKERNRDKGTALEKLMLLVFKRFEIIKEIKRDKLTGDNEVDLYVNLNENIPIPFINNTNGKIICECKNMNDKSVDVGMVSKLSELCTSKLSKLGIFVSIRGISGRGWIYGEGKRRKLFIETKVPIISFTFEEIKLLAFQGNNFYSMIKRKIQELIDEVEYDGEKLKKIKNTDEYKETILYNIKFLYKIGVITEIEKNVIKERLKEVYN